MNTIAVIELAGQAHGLPALVDRAARALAGARTSAEVLEACAAAGFARNLRRPRFGKPSVCTRLRRPRRDAGGNIRMSPISKSCWHC